MIKNLSKERDLLVLTHEPKRKIGLTCSQIKEEDWTYLLTNQRGRLDSLAHKSKRKIGLICSQIKEGDWTHLLTNQRGRLDSLACKDVFLYLQEELVPCYLLLEFAWVCHVELDTKLQGQSMRAWVMGGREGRGSECGSTRSRIWRDREEKERGGQ